MNVKEVEAYIQKLRRETAEMSEPNAQSEAAAFALVQLESALEEIRKLEARVAQAEALKNAVEGQLKEVLIELTELKRTLFGRKSDKLTPQQEEAMAEIHADLVEEQQRPKPLTEDLLEDGTPEPVKGRITRHPLPAELERQESILEPEPLAICAHCGKAPEKIGQECTEQLDYIPARLVVRRIVRPKYACRCGEAGVQVAPLPAQLLPQSKLGLGLAVHILLSRFDDHISYYAIERVFRERHGAVIPRQQMVQWMAHVATLLQPLWLILLAHLKQEAYLQIDETPVKVLDPEVQGRAATGWLWFYAVPGGDVLLDFQDTRGQRAPLERLQGFHGTIQTDAYEVYESLLKVIGTLKRIGCLAHSRRKFYQAMRQGDVQAVWFILRLRDLYRIERLTREMTPEERHRLRQEHAPAIWESIRLKAHELKPKLLPKSTLGKAVSYFLSEYDALCGYLADGRFEIDNNLVENAIRNPVIGRKRWLFIGHPEAGWRSAVLYSFILSCRRRALNPQDYLTDILRRLPTTPQSDLHQLLPAHWKPLAPA